MYMENKELFSAGNFFTGCNYWASHAGTNMWHDWDAGVVDSDLARLEKADIRVMRMFPLWSDFQPLKMHRAGGSSEREIRLGEDPLPFTEAGRAGVDEKMADRFQIFCDLAEKHHIKLIVGLIPLKNCAALRKAVCALLSIAAMTREKNSSANSVWFFVCSMSM